MTPPLTLHNPAPAGQPGPDDLLTFRQVCDLLGISQAAGERLKAAGRLPPHIALTRRSHRWRRAAILDYLRRLEQETAQRQSRAR